jgi:hypothetical protein
VAAQKMAYDSWRSGAMASFAMPYQTTITVGGDPDTYYPVPIASTTADRIGKISISGGSQTAQLVTQLSVRGDAWYGTWLTRIEMHKIWGAALLGRIETQNIGRMVWLRGGGRDYKISSDFEILKDQEYFGTKQLVPILVANTPIYTGHPVAPYVGGNFKVSPLPAQDSRWATEINLPTLL